MPAVVSKIAQYPHRTLAIAGLFTLFLVIPLSAIVVFSTVQKSGTGAKAASIPTFTVSNVTQIAKEIGPDGNNSTQNVDVCGADLGSMFDWNGKVYNVFGDTFGCPLNPTQPNWRSNALATSVDTNPTDGITFDNWIKGVDGKAKELIANDPVSSTETAIPTYGVSVGTIGYLYYFEGQIAPSWTCSYSSVAKSTDGGQNWTKLTNLKWDPGNFNQVAIYKKDGYVYFFGIPCARAGEAKMMRVLEGSIESKSAYEYLTGYDAISNPVWTVNAESSAVSIVPAPVGELSVRFNNYLGQYIMMYLKDVSPYTIEIRSAPNLWGPWGEPQVVTTGSTYPCVYAPYMREGYDENNGQTVYFRMSRFCPGFDPYSTYWMKMTLNVNGPIPTSSPSFSPSPTPTNLLPPCYFTDSTGAQWGYGDVNNNNVLNAADATLVLRSYFGIDPPLTGDAFKAGDVNGNNILNASDATLIKQYVFGITTTFKACTSVIPTLTPTPSP
ncbi:MAG: DUF4185 domain-containing protein [Patescibacteria group bacterium]